MEVVGMEGCSQVSIFSVYLPEIFCIFRYIIRLAYFLYIFWKNGVKMLGIGLVAGFVVSLVYVSVCLGGFSVYIWYTFRRVLGGGFSVWRVSGGGGGFTVWRV